MIRRHPPGFLCLLCLLCQTSLSFAEADSFILGPDEKLEEERWIQAEEIQLEGLVNQDVYLLGSNLVLNADFRDNVWAMGQSLSFEGEASDEIRAAAVQSIRLGGRIDKGITAYAKTIQVRPEAVCRGSARFLAENIIIEGEMEHAWLAASKVTVKGQVTGNLRIIAEDIVILPGSSIGGDLRYTTGKELVLGKGVHLGGELLAVPMEDFLSGPSAWLGSRWGWIHLILFGNALLLGVVYVFFFSRQVGAAVRVCRVFPFRALFTGSILFLVLPGLSQLLFMSRFGIPAALVLIGLYGLGLYLGKLIVALLVGGLILRLKGRQSISRVLLSLLLGLAFLYFMMSLPVLGFMIWITLGTFGLGGIVISHMGTRLIRMQKEPSGSEDDAEAI